MNAQNQELERLNMLIVDDEPAILSALNGLFRRKYQVVTADNAEAALALIENQEMTFHLILTDQRMPGMNGCDLLSVIREKYSYTANVLITGYSDVEDLVKAVNEGQIFGYVAKPWNPKELKFLISKAEEQCRLHLEKDSLAATLKQQIQEHSQKLEQASRSFFQLVSHLKHLSPQDREPLLDELENLGEQGLHSWLKRIDPP